MTNTGSNELTPLGKLLVSLFQSSHLANLVNGRKKKRHFAQYDRSYALIHLTLALNLQN